MEVHGDGHEGGKGKMKFKVYAYDFSFTILWSVFISSSGRPTKDRLVDRPETLRTMLNEN